MTELPSSYYYRDDGSCVCYDSSQQIHESEGLTLGGRG